MLKVDDPRVMDSTGALDLPDIPKSLLVVGGGYIGLELGSVYAALGSAVTVVEMTPGLLPGRRPRSRRRPRQARIKQAMKSVLLEHAGDADEGRDRRASASPSKAKASRTGRPNRCSIACWSRSAGGRTRRFRASTGRACRSIERGFIVVDEQRRTARAVDLRDRRRRRRADARAQGVARRPRRRRSDRRARTSRSSPGRFRPSCSPIPSSRGPVSPRRRRRRTGARSSIAKFPWGASGRAITLDRTDGLTKLDPRSRHRADPRRRPGRPRRRRADRGRRAGDRDGRERHRPEAVDSPAPDAHRDDDGVGRSVLRPGDARLPAEALTGVPNLEFRTEKSEVAPSHFKLRTEAISPPRVSLRWSEATSCSVTDRINS